MGLKVTVVAAGAQKILNQDYPVTIIQEVVENAPDYFNKQLDEVESDVFCFLSHLDNFNSGYTISKAIQKLEEYDSFGLIYTDGLSVNDGYTSNMYYPAFHPNLLFSDMIINSPLIIKTPSKKLRFEPTLNLLYFHEFFQKIGRNAEKRIFPVHIAEPLFISTIDNSINFEDELKKLAQCQNQ